MPDLPPPVPVIEINLASTGMSKGLAQTTGPQFLARSELGFGPIYVGAYVKNVTSPTTDGETGGLLGVRTKAGTVDLAASAAVKRAIDAAAGSDATALELSGAISRKFGALTPRMSVVWSPDDLGSTGRSVFAEAGASYAVRKGIAISAAVGRRERTGAPDYTAWNAGIVWNPLKPVTIDLRYYDTNGGNTQPFRARAVLSARIRV